MANVKTLYGDATRAAKRQNAERTSMLTASSHPDAKEELRLFEVFRRRAREDFKTLSQPAKAARS